jgi:pSer/pThr/pTyr-binding forkhead associated (FHA) protein
MWKLTIEDDDGQQTALDLSLEEYTVGRAEDQSIRLTERNISRKHAILRMGPDGWQLEDQGSYNGTFVNGERVVEAVDLSSGDTVQLGDYRIELLDAAEAQPATEQRQRRPDRLVVVIGPVPGAEYSLEGDRLSVGRAEEAQVSVNHASVSRLHAELHALGQGRWEVVDQGSSNGIRINGVDLRRGIIEPGDALEFGDVRLRFVAAGKFFRPTIDLSAQLPAMGNLAGKDQSTQRSIGTILAVAAAVCVLILVAVVMVGGGSGPSTGTASSAAPMATSEAEQREVLNHAVKLADDDVYAAHEELRRIPESSALYDSEELRAVEDR